MIHPVPTIDRFSSSSCHAFSLIVRDHIYLPVLVWLGLSLVNETGKLSNTYEHHVAVTIDTILPSTPLTRIIVGGICEQSGRTTLRPKPG